MLIFFYILFILITYAILLTDKHVIVATYYSELFGPREKDTEYYIHLFVLSILFPITIPVYFYLKQTNNPMKFKFKHALIITIVMIFGLIVQSSYNYYKDLYNTAVAYEGKYTNLTNQRLTARNNITTILTESLHTANINSDKYENTLKAVTDSRKQNTLLWQWIVENNPNSNFDLVSDMYNNVQKLVKIQRDNLTTIETDMSNLNDDYYRFRNSFPNNIFLYSHKSTLGYTPLATDANRAINKTGVDNNIEIPN